SLDPYDTVAAVLSCVAPAPSLRGGLVSAVQLGGDTDTVAALVGGLLGGKLTVEQVHGELPWHQSVVLPGPQSAMSEIAAALATVRAVRSA
ncbi:MAG: ADP-ribosylglycohydrolase family protein, partial [Pseudonocardiales bacterium]|nr:ADP-ribosylglycohydrolase family protein [Pseudonocardiales bacterium]